MGSQGGDGSLRKFSYPFIGPSTILERYKLEISNAVSPELFNCSTGVFSDNQAILHYIYHIKSVSALRKMSVFLILNVLPLI